MFLNLTELFGSFSILSQTTFGPGCVTKVSKSLLKPARSGSITALSGVVWMSLTSSPAMELLAS